MYSPDDCQRRSVAHRANNRDFNHDTAVGKQCARGYFFLPYYRQVSNIRRNKSQHFKDYRTVLRLSLPNPFKPDVKSRMKM